MLQMLRHDAMDDGTNLEMLNPSVGIQTATRLVLRHDYFAGIFRSQKIQQFLPWYLAAVWRSSSNARVDSQCVQEMVQASSTKAIDNTHVDRGGELFFFLSWVCALLSRRC